MNLSFLGIITIFKKNNYLANNKSWHVSFFGISPLKEKHEANFGGNTTYK